jgi:hypothetical protein
MAKLGSYTSGRIVVDGENQTSDLIVLSDPVASDWWRRQCPLALEDLEALQHELPERLIVGCGANGRLESNAGVIEALPKRGLRSRRTEPTRRSAAAGSRRRDGQRWRFTSPAEAGAPPTALTPLRDPRGDRHGQLGPGSRRQSYVGNGLSFA